MHLGRELIKAIMNDSAAANQILGGVPSVDLAVKVRVYARQMIENQVWRNVGRWTSGDSFLLLLSSRREVQGMTSRRIQIFTMTGNPKLDIPTFE